VEDGAGSGSVRTRARTICDQGGRAGSGEGKRKIWAVEDDTWAPHVGQGARTGGSARRITRPWGPASTWTMPCACRVPAGVTHLWHAGPQ
jgi:hypothetical protein